MSDASSSKPETTLATRADDLLETILGEFETLVNVGATNNEGEVVPITPTQLTAIAKVALDIKKALAPKEEPKAKQLGLFENVPQMPFK